MLSSYLDLGIYSVQITLGLIGPELRDPMEKDINQILFGVARELNCRHPANPFAGPLPARLAGYP